MAFQFEPNNVEKYGYPINKEQAEQILQMSQTPAWQLFMHCIRFEAEAHKQAALNTGYGPNALEIFRFNQALAHNIERIPNAVIEGATSVLEHESSLNSLYDQLHLSPE